MKERVWSIIGFLWASPVTLISFLFYVAPLWVLGKYTFAGWDEVAWVFRFDPSRQTEGYLTQKLRTLWRQWSGSTLGTLIVIKDDTSAGGPRKNVLVHEKEHVRQIMRLGVFQPIIYALVSFAIRVGCSNANFYYDNPFEVSARRRAGELIDIVGVINKLKG